MNFYPHRRMKGRNMKKIVIVMLMLCMGGCATHNQTKLGGGEVEAVTTTANLASIDSEGNIMSAYHGLGAFEINQDVDGNYSVMPGPVGAISIPGVGFLISPKDIVIKGFAYTPEPSPGNPVFAVESLEANVSAPITAQIEGLRVALPVLADMTKAEALARIEQMRIAGDIAESMAPLLAQIINLFLQ